MGDIRFAAPYRRVKKAADAQDEILRLSDEDVIAALSAAAAEGDPYLSNVLTTEAQNRVTRYAATVANMADGVLATGPMGRLVGMNPAAERMLGWTLHEARGKDADALLACTLLGRDGQWRACSVCADALAADGPAHEDEAIFLRKDGTRFPASYTAAPIRQEGETRGAVVVFRDVTQRRRNEEAVRRLAAIVEASDDAILSLALDGTILTWNPRAAQLYGYSAAEAIGKNAALVVPAELRDDFERLLAHVRSGEELHHHATKRLQRGGKILDISLTATPIRDERGDVVALSWIAEDVTEAKRREEALRASEETYRLLLDSVTDHAIFLLDTRGHVISWNPAAEKIKGWKAEEIIGWHYSVLFPPEEVAQGDPWKELEDAAKNGRHDGEERRMRKDGSLFDASITLSAMRNAEGKLVGFVKVTRDVTERKQWERRLQLGEARSQRLFELHPEPLLWCEPNGDIVAGNHAVRDLLGFDAVDIVGRPFESLCAYEDRTRVREAVDAVKEQGRAQVRVAAMASGGTALVADCVLDAILVDGHATGFFVVMRERAEP